MFRRVLFRSQVQTVATAKFETLLHGPIHEAFMHPFSANATVDQLETFVTTLRAALTLHLGAGSGVFLSKMYFLAATRCRRCRFPRPILHSMSLPMAG